MDARGLGPDVVSDDALLARLLDHLGRSRRAEADLVALFAEVDARRLYLREACSSMHAYATGRLHMSDAEAYLRITVARLSRRFPILLAMLADGRLHLSGIARLAPHLRSEDGEQVLARAIHLSKREIDMLVAELSPRPDAPALIRRLPGSPRPPERTAAVTLPGEASDGTSHTGYASSRAAAGRESATAASIGTVGGEPASESSSDSPLASPRLAPPGPPSMGGSLGAGENRSAVRPESSVVTPTAPGRYKVQLTVGAELRDKIARAQALLRHQVPDGNLAVVLDRAMTLLLRELERARFAATSSPRKSPDQVDPTPSSRGIPAPIRRAVWARDGGQCTFRSPAGQRCSATERLEFHHVIPFAKGGDHAPGNVRLYCARHNLYQAELDFGLARMAAHRQRAPSAASDSRAPRGAPP